MFGLINVKRDSWRVYRKAAYCYIHPAVRAIQRFRHEKVPSVSRGSERIPRFGSFVPICSFKIFMKWGVRGAIAPRENFTRNEAFFRGKNWKKRCVLGWYSSERNFFAMIFIGTPPRKRCFLYTFEKKHNECNGITSRRNTKFAIVICLQNSAILWRKYTYFKRETNAYTADIP